MSRHIDFDEAFSIALLGLGEAISRFDASRGTEFDAFAGRVIRNEFLQFLQGCRPLGYRSDADRKADAPEYPQTGVIEATEEDSFARDDPPHQDIDHHEWVTSLSRRMPPRCGELVRLHYLEARCERMDHCAEVMGLKPNRASQIHQEAIGHMREVLAKGA